MKIGVFDSGVGGLSVANAIQAALPALEITYVEDKAHVPYGTKSPERIYGFVLPILQKLVRDGCELIVIACNTVTTNLITQLRRELAVPLVGMEPMVKPAAEHTKTKVIAVCATPRTLLSERYAWLKQTYTSDVTVLEPDCSEWSSLIEAKQINERHIRATIEPLLQQGADVIVLGCTHYHWIEQEIKAIAAGRAEVLQPERAVIAQLQRIISQ